MAIMLRQIHGQLCETETEGHNNHSFIDEQLSTQVVGCSRQSRYRSQQSEQSDVIIEMTPPPTPVSKEQGNEKHYSIESTPNESDSHNHKEHDHLSEQAVGWFGVFRFASSSDKILCILGTLAAVAHGAVMPLLCWIFGVVVDEFVDPNESCSIKNLTTNNTDTTSEIASNETLLSTTNIPLDRETQTIAKLCIIFAILGAVSFLVSLIQSLFWSLAAENQVNAIRTAYFRNLLRQDIAWYDTQEMGALTARFIEDIAQIGRGIGDKIGLFVQNMGAFIGCTILGLCTGWELCLVTLSLTPLNFLSSYLMVRVAFSQTNSETKAYASAGAVAQEVLSSIRTVTAFGRQSDEVERYAFNLKQVKKVGIKSGYYTGLVMGGMYFFLIAAYALGFAYGVVLINDSNSGYTLGKAILVIWAVLEGTYAFGFSLTAIRSLATSRVAAYRVFKVTDRKPPIDVYDNAGVKCDKESFVGRIELLSIKFAYPTRRDVPVVDGISLAIEPGATVALVGASGCGKSTILQLLQRYYDPDDGQVLIDGLDLRKYNIASFRSFIGSVSQEPVLFAASIYENIRYGFPEATRLEIEAAARLANAHDFISKLPLGYDTMVGEQGAQLSGGQKQRIAIARALVRNPRILLLDEATSALDTESEAIVQDALDRARNGRTTIEIAHRLSAVVSADKIIVLDHGKVCEVGTHAELIAKRGVYAKLVEAQQGSRSGPIETDVRAIQQRRSALVNMRLENNMGNSEADEENNAPRKRRLTLSEQKKRDAEVVRNHYSALRLWRMASSEMPYYIVGSFGAAICGVVWPAFAIILGLIIQAFSACTADERLRDAVALSVSLIGVAGAMFIGFTLMFSMFGIAGERVVLKVRKLAFLTMLRQDIAWFDDNENSPGALTSRLAIQATAVKDATGAQLGQIVVQIVGIIASFLIAFLYDWRTTLVMMVCAPLSLMSGVIQAVVFGDSAAQDKFIEEAAKSLAASTSNIRTVTSLGIYQSFLDQFAIPLQKRHKRKLIKIIVIAICFGLVETVTLDTYAAGFYAASYFVRWGVTDFGSVFTAMIAIMFNSYFIGQANAMVPDQAKAHLGVAEIFKLLDRKPAIRWDDDDNGKKCGRPAHCSGKAVFSSIQFYYPTRKSSPVLQGLDVKVKAGQTVALVGASGCGKSTLIQLIERFYDPQSGDVYLDDSPLVSLNLPWARSQMALVSQEPILFDRTVAENIAYGATDRSFSESEIETAARMANIHSFIMSLPNGYRTRVGQRGGKLSGGQKQRIAIARALIRKPKLLLLDEATSALDSESEQLVQEALDKARTGRTVLMIAHRLSTVANCDLIVVIQGGVVKESGKHADLLEKKGIYYGLWSAQQLSVFAG